MQIILGKTAGFCFGVSNAVKKAEEELNKTKELYCLGELVHNNQVTKELTKKGIKFIDNIEEAKGNLIIRSHGVDKKIYERGKELNLRIIDLTCPKVLKIHKIAEKYANENYYIFFVAQKNHPETKGTVGFCGVNINIIEKKDDIKNALENLKKSNLKKLLVISQTTFNMEEFDGIIEEIKKQTPKNIKIEINKTICSATQLRQEETIEISKQVEFMIIIGGKNSSNTNKLYEISKKYCLEVVFVETKKDLDINHIKKFKKIGIMAGASTPNENIMQIVDILKNIC